MADNRKYYYLKLKENYLRQRFHCAVGGHERRGFVFQYPLEAVLKIAEKWRQDCSLTSISPIPPR